MFHDFFDIFLVFEVGNHKEYIVIISNNSSFLDTISYILLEALYKLGVTLPINLISISIGQVV